MPASGQLRQVPCPRCRSEDSVIVAEGRDFLYGLPGRWYASECRACRLWFQNPRPADEELPALYPAHYGPHVPGERVAGLGLSPGRTRYLRRRFGYDHLKVRATTFLDWRALRVFDRVRQWTTGVDLLPTFIAHGSLLEIGCGNGARLVGLRRLGWERLYGIELVPGAAAQARSLGLDVRCGFVEEVLDDFADASLDVVVSSMVLEHLSNPFAVVEQVAAKLKPGGQFLFSTITRDALDARVYGRYWAGFDFPRHLVYLRSDDICGMLSDSFAGIERFHHADPVDFVRSSTWRCKDGEGTLVDRVIRALGTSPLARMYSLVLAALGLTCRVSFRCQRR